MLIGLFNKLRVLILGTHPQNTCASFNWHNVRHINKFFATRTANLGKKKSLVIADIGGGRSPYYAYFEPFAAEYIVVELQESLPAQETRKIRQVVGAGENIPLPSNTVDVVICNQVLEHVIDPNQTVSEIFRILKPDGRFMGSVPHVSPIHLEPCDFRRYTLFGMQQLLADSGFYKIDVQGNSGVFATAALMINMDLVLSRRKDGEGQKVFDNFALLIFPFVALLNLTALIIDRVLGDKKRTPANLCWEAQKGRKSCCK